ncbi:hypothetical protein GCM10010994_28930 [Chelatococcus reniformis]|uniref:Uncharacterized protein n=2 Tax=Chelatococcus reniformis TaxID=1494448 RepID=A0A916XFL1_9HYPH|nr:hypothetical protein GCM10010994_28930 [Chelatococcus reniformis]
MMNTDMFVAVEATEERYRALTHQPTGIPFDESGRSRWPADAFTFRLRNEGSIRILDGAADKPAVATTSPAPKTKEG